MQDPITSALLRTKREVFTRTLSGLWDNTKMSRIVSGISGLVTYWGCEGVAKLAGTTFLPQAGAASFLSYSVGAVFAGAVAGTMAAMPFALAMRRAHGPGPFVPLTDATAWEIEDAYWAHLHAPLDAEVPTLYLPAQFNKVSPDWHTIKAKESQQLRSRLASLTAQAIADDMAKPMDESSPVVMIRAAFASQREETSFVLEQTPAATQEAWVARELERENSPFFKLYRSNPNARHVTKGASLDSPYILFIRDALFAFSTFSPLLTALQKASPEKLLERAVIDQVPSLVALNERDMATETRDAQKAATLEQAQSLTKTALRPFPDAARVLSSSKAQELERAVVSAYALKQAPALQAG